MKFIDISIIFIPVRDPGDPRQLRALLHRHLQQARIHRLVGQLRGTRNDKDAEEEVIQIQI